MGRSDVECRQFAVELGRSGPGRSAAYWSSWADGLHMIRRRHALVADLIWELSSDPAHHLEGVVRARNRLEDVGFNAPSWETLAVGVRLEVNSLVGPTP